VFLLKRYFEVMKKTVKMMVATAVATSSGVALAESSGAMIDPSSAGQVAIAAGLAVAIGALGTALGQGKVAAALMEGVTRNPSSRGEVFTPFLLGLALIEFQTILCFIIAFFLQGKIG
jgi:F-type H+-transporting ATPase subunit c